MPFVKGQSGNPGGKPGPARQELNALLDRVFTTPKRKKVLEKLISDAEAGDHEARTLLLAYTYGRPTERREITGAEGTPFIPFDWNATVTEIAEGSDDDPDTPE
jgi:hypothetical protein